PLHLHSFPTRRSSDLESVTVDGPRVTQQGWRLMQGISLKIETAFHAWNALWEGMLAVHNRGLKLTVERDGETLIWRVDNARPLRSEEHTSELQSLAYL